MGRNDDALLAAACTIFENGTEYIHAKTASHDRVVFSDSTRWTQIKECAQNKYELHAGREKKAFGKKSRKEASISGIGIFGCVVILVLI